MEFESSLHAQDNVKKKAKNIHYFEWIFFFTEDQKKIINESIDKNRQNLYSWLIFTIALPLLTYTFAVVINLVLTPFCDLHKSWALILNNGSLPIAAFGIISSGVPYLMESMRNPKDEIYDLRKRIMAIATVFMFLTSGLFLFQSISPNIVQLNKAQPSNWADD